MKVEKLTGLKRILFFSCFSTVNLAVQFFYSTILIHFGILYDLCLYTLLCNLFLVSVISAFNKMFMEIKIH